MKNSDASTPFLISMQIPSAPLAVLLRPALATGLAALMLGAALDAQCTSPGSTSALQQAIDAAPPGALIVIGPGGPSSGGERVWIDKPLTLLGTPGAPPIQFEVVGFSASVCDGGAITIGPSVAGAVTLQGLVIEGLSAGNPGCVPGGIRCCSPDATLVVSGCTVRGADYKPGVGDGGSGEAGILGTAKLLVVLDSTVEGGSGEQSISAGPGGDGAPAVSLAGEALFVRSRLVGGDGGPTHASPVAPTYSFCGSFYEPATAGAAVEATKVSSWGSVGIGGDPGAWLDCAGSIMGYGQPGADLPAGPLARFRGDPSVSVGSILTLEVVGGGGANAVYLGTHGWQPSIDVPSLGPYFLGSSPALVYQGPWPDMGLQLPIPPQAALVGAQGVFQALIGSQLTNPIQVVLKP